MTLELPLHSELGAKTQPELPGWEEQRGRDRHRSHQDRKDRAMCSQKGTVDAFCFCRTQMNKLLL